MLFVPCFSAIDGGTFVSVVDTLTADDVHFRSGSTEHRSEKAALVATSEALGGVIAGIRHDIGALWESEPGTVVVTRDVHHRRVDGQEVSTPSPTRR